MGEMSKLRHKAKALVVKCLSEQSSQGAFGGLFTAHSYLEGKEGLTAVQVRECIEEATKHVVDTQAALNDDVWEEVAAATQLQLETEIEAYHAQLDDLNKRLAELSKDMVQRRQDVEGTLVELTEVLGEAWTVADTRVKQKEGAVAAHLAPGEVVIVKGALLPKSDGLPGPITVKQVQMFLQKMGEDGLLSNTNVSAAQAKAIGVHLGAVPSPVTAAEEAAALKALKVHLLETSAASVDPGEGDGDMCPQCGQEVDDDEFHDGDGDCIGDVPPLTEEQEASAQKLLAEQAGHSPGGYDVLSTF